MIVKSILGVNKYVVVDSKISEQHYGGYCTRFFGARPHGGSGRTRMGRFFFF